MKFQAHDFLDPLIITPEVIRSALEPAIESLDLYMAGKYAGAVISGPVAMAAAQDAREFQNLTPLMSITNLISPSLSWVMSTS